MSDKRIASSYGRKDEAGAYEPALRVEELRDTSIDGLLSYGLEGIHQLLKDIRRSIADKDYDRETVMNLKDAMGMLHMLKEKEQDLLNKLSDEELEKIARGNSGTQPDSGG